MSEKFIPNDVQYSLLNGLYSCVVVLNKNRNDPEIMASMAEKFPYYANELDKNNVPWSIQNRISVAGEKRDNWGRYNRTVINEICGVTVETVADLVARLIA